MDAIKYKYKRIRNWHPFTGLIINNIEEEILFISFYLFSLNYGSKPGISYLLLYYIGSIIKEK